MYQHTILKKLGYGVCSLCVVNFPTSNNKSEKNEEAKRRVAPLSRSLSLLNVAHCESMKAHQHSPSTYQLLDVHIFFRHGARTPIKHLPGVDEVVYDKEKWEQVQAHTNIPYTVETPDGKPRPESRLEQHYKKIYFKGGMIAGSLTSVGRQQAYDLGKRLRQRYMQDVKFVKTTFNSKEVAIRSTNVERCIQSLRSVMAGMYGKESFKDPLVIHVVPLDAEILFPNFRFCDTLRKLERNAPDYLKEQNGYKALSHYIRHFAKLKEDTLIEMMYWRDHMVARQAHGLKVPLWFEPVEDEIQMWATKSLEIHMCGVPQDRLLALQLAAGPMLNLAVEGFQTAIKDRKQGARLHLYSCHDSSLMPLLHALGIFDHKWPPFTADVAMELYMTPEKELFVKISYNGKDVTFPGYDTPMVPYTKFQEMISPYLVTPSQYMKRCHDMDLAREHAKQWETVVQSHEQEESDEEAYENPPNI